MAFRKGSKVELTRAVATAPSGSCGKVTQVYKNGNYRVRITHDPGCVELVFPTHLASVPPAALRACNC